MSSDSVYRTTLAASLMELNFLSNFLLSVAPADLGLRNPESCNMDPVEAGLLADKFAVDNR